MRADERQRDLERRLAAIPGDASARLSLARELARRGKRLEAGDEVEAVLRDEPLHEGALAALDDVGASPLARLAPWPTVHGGNDRARRSAHPGPRKGRLARRLRIGAPAGKLGNGDVESALSLTVGQETAYLATNHRRLIALDLASGQARWIREFEHAFAAPSVGAGERLALPMLDSVRLLDGRTGETLWIARGPGVTGDPVPANATFAPRGLVLAPGLRGALYALDAATGKLRWSHATRGAQYAAPAVHGDRIYLTCTFGEVHALDLEGKRVARARLEHPGGVLPLMAVVHGSRVLVARPFGEAGAVVTLEREDLGRPRLVAAKVGAVPLLAAIDEDRFLSNGVVADAALRREGGFRPIVPEPLPVADSGGCVFAWQSVSPSPYARLAWFDSSGGTVKVVYDLPVGTLAIGPASTAVVGSQQQGFLQFVE